MQNVHADFYEDLDVNFVVTVFDPNKKNKEANLELELCIEAWPFLACVSGMLE